MSVMVLTKRCSAAEEVVVMLVVIKANDLLQLGGMWTAAAYGAQLLGQQHRACT